MICCGIAQGGVAGPGRNGPIDGKKGFSEKPAAISQTHSTAIILISNRSTYSFIMNTEQKCLCAIIMP